MPNMLKIFEHPLIPFQLSYADLYVFLLLDTLMDPKEPTLAKDGSPPTHPAAITTLLETRPLISDLYSRLKS